tara:strand:+ start:829 stop:1116 length:288 start_codon:yes stop_codon:yes gene_type:complete
MGLKYKNKYFREVLERDLKEQGLGVNIHCKKDAIYLTIPPHTDTVDSPDQLSYSRKAKVLVNKIKKLVKSYKINVILNESIYNDNMKIKLKVYEG